MVGDREDGLRPPRQLVDEGIEGGEEPEAPVEDIDYLGAGGRIENHLGAGGPVENDLGAGGLIANDLRVGGRIEMLPDECGEMPPEELLIKKGKTPPRTALR